jgi:hypothetical protein
MKNILLIATVYLALTSCKKQATSWDTELGAPLINDTLDLSKLTDNQTLVGNANGTLDLDLTKTILDLGLADIVSIPDTQVIQIFNPAIALNVPAGFNVFNETEEHTIDIPGVQLKKIRVFSGKIDLNVYNPLPTSVTFNVTLPGVYNNGLLFQQSLTAGAGDNSNPTVGSGSLDLSGYEMDLRGINGISFNILQASVVAVTDPTGPAVSVTPAQQFKVEATLKDIALDYARGYFGNQVFSDTTGLTVDYLNNIVSGLVDVNNIQLSLSLSNGMKVPVKSELTLIENVNSTGNSVALSAPCIGQDLYLAPAVGAWDNLIPSTQQIQINSQNSNVEQVFENLGATMNLGYKITINPNGNVNGGWDEIFSTSRLKVDLHAQMPLQLQADQLTLADTFAVSLTQNTAKTHVTGGYFQLDASNAFPMQCQMKLSFLDANSQVIEETIGDALVLSAVAGTQNASGMYVKNSSVKFYLSKTLMEQINQVKYIRVEGILDTPNPSGSANQQVSIPMGAFLHVRLKAKLQTQIVY